MLSCGLYRIPPERIISPVTLNHSSCPPVSHKQDERGGEPTPPESQKRDKAGRCWRRVNIIIGGVWVVGSWGEMGDTRRSDVAHRRTSLSAALFTPCLCKG
ncbi:unnamed protein product [Leptosia nina]|uniref:Uncharacterized protein n=1 Tax=Leptosia nina TaxID=320188 RepID=A0AAV1J6I6_9NEOP